MESRTPDQDILLVKECLSGSENAWTEFYCRYEPLVKSIARKQPWLARHQVEDVTQTVFVSLMSDLETWDQAHSLSAFVVMIAKRDCIDEYRKHKAAKRDAVTNPVDHHDGAEGYESLASNCNHQEEELAEAQEKELLRRARVALGERCQDLLELRIFEELPYKEITELLGASENTLTVQFRRCLDELRANFHELVRKGVGWWKSDTDPTQ